ncbi:hypothetical protein H8959_002228 [Pygathrix nigripes]
MESREGKNKFLCSEFLIKPITEINMRETSGFLFIAKEARNDVNIDIPIIVIRRLQCCSVLLIMLRLNITLVTEFILVGFPAAPWLQILLFFLFLVVCLLVVVENLAIMLTVWVTSFLHKPMYYFLSSMSFLEVWYVSVAVPKMLDGFLLQRRCISFTGCVTQLYFFILLACTEGVLLAAMAYDHYVATCHPLRYSVIMTIGYCGQLVDFSYMSGFMVSVIKVYFISHVAFCGSNVMNHFFCDISPILKLACKDMSTAELVDFALAIAILVFLSLPLSSPISTLFPQFCMYPPSREGRRPSPPVHLTSL